MEPNNWLDAPSSPSPSRLEAPVGMSLTFLVLMILFGALIGFGIIYALGLWWGMDLEESLLGIQNDGSATDRNFVRSTVLINHLTMFVVPGLLFALFFYGRQWAAFLRLKVWPKADNVLGGVVLLLVAFPFVQFLYWFNSRYIPLPEWARMAEASTADAVSGLLVTNGVMELVFNVVVIALIPALGEELIFRGIIQRKLGEAFRRPAVAIWVAAFLFSAFHMQFEGFLPRLMLGALLGYLYFWTKNLWVPIVAHFMNNFVQIVLQYLFAERITDIDIEQIDAVPLWQWLISLGLMLAVAHWMRKLNNTQQL